MAKPFRRGKNKWRIRWTDAFGKRCNKTFDSYREATEWKMLEEDLGLNFVEILEGATSEFFSEPLLWNDMVQVMGKNGMRGPDAMILNLFLKSAFPLLITGDGDFESCLKDSGGAAANKAVLFL